jgi:hypothetical protein
LTKIRKILRVLLHKALILITKGIFMSLETPQPGVLHPSHTHPDAAFDNTCERTTNRWGNNLHAMVVHEEINLAHRQISARLGNAILSGASILPCAIDTIAGLIGGAIALLTLGLEKHTVNFAARELHATNDLIAKPFEFLLRTINPKAEFSTSHPSSQSDISRAIEEIPLAGRMGNVARACAQGENFFIRHVVSRVSYLATALIAVISRIALATLAAPTVALAVVTLGSFGKINRFASKTLQASGIIADLFTCIIKCINPSAGEQTGPRATAD